MTRIVGLSLVVAFMGSGCAIPIGANLTGVVGADTIGGGSCTVVPAPVLASKPTLESGGYGVDLAAWNQEFADDLATELKDAGVTVGEGDPVEIGVVNFIFRDNPQTSAMEMTFEIEVSYGDYKGHHKGYFEDDSIINSSSTQTAWEAAGIALSNLLKDPAFIEALKGS